MRCSRDRKVAKAILTFGFPLFLLSTAAAAENRVGGHFGFVLPLVTRVDGEETTISDDFTIGFPMGITVKRMGRMAFDLELVPSIQDQPLDVDLTVHPGLVWDLGGFAAGVRAAFDVGAASWGFTPLINKGWPVGDQGDVFFAELVLPVRFQEDSRGEKQTAFTIGAHFGWGF